MSDLNINIKPKHKWILGVVSAVSVYFIIKFFNKTMKDNLENTDLNEAGYDLSPVWDAKSETIISELHPSIRNKAKAFINEAEKQGIKLKVTSGGRTYEEQNKLYAQGRTTKGSIVTNAKAGYSWHNFFLAFDVVPVENGKINWKSKNWKKIGDLGKTFGLEWGGDWKTFKDLPHFQTIHGLTTAQARAKKTKNEVDNKGYILV
jgi:hypothetical protein